MASGSPARPGVTPNPIPFQSMKSLNSTFLSCLLLAGLASSCTITRVDSHSGPARIEARGLIEGHAAVGILAEDQLLYLDIFDGTSDGSFLEFGLWKLLRLEVGLAGASVSVGPLHIGVGVLDYEPEVPRMESDTRPPKKDKSCGGFFCWDADDCNDDCDDCNECDEGACDVPCEEEQVEEIIEDHNEAPKGVLVDSAASTSGGSAVFEVDKIE